MFSDYPLIVCALKEVFCMVKSAHEALNACRFAEPRKRLRARPKKQMLGQPYSDTMKKRWVMWRGASD